MKNVGTLDSIFRIIIGTFLVLLSYFYLSGVWQIVLYVIGGILLISGITSRCYLYRLLGINTYKKHEMDNVDNIEIEPKDINSNIKDIQTEGINTNNDTENIQAEEKNTEVENNNIQNREL